jgi:hypothetical protein
MLVSTHRHQQPHDLKPGERFDSACLYMNDQGECYCGAHVGTAATYTPWAWSCIGVGPAIEYSEGGRTVTFRCEIPHA